MRNKIQRLVCRSTSPGPTPWLASLPILCLFSKVGGLALERTALIPAPNWGFWETRGQHKSPEQETWREGGPLWELVKVVRTPETNFISTLCVNDCKVFLSSLSESLPVGPEVISQLLITRHFLKGVLGCYA